MSSRTTLVDRRLVKLVTEGLPEVHSEEALKRHLGSTRRFHRALCSLLHSDLRKVTQESLDSVLGLGPQLQFPVFKTIRLGTSLKTPQSFLDALSSAGCLVRPWTAALLTMPEFRVFPYEVEADLVAPTLQEMGVGIRFRGHGAGATGFDVHARRLELGLHLMPLEACLQLRLGYLDQPVLTRLYPGMEPLRDPRGGLATLIVAHSSDGLELTSGVGDLAGSWSYSAHWVFISQVRRVQVEDGE